MLKKVLRNQQKFNEKLDYLTNLLQYSLAKESEMASDNSLNKLPLVNLVELKEFNKKLDDEEYFQKHVAQLKLIGGKDGPETTRRLLRKIVGHDLSVVINWSGRNEKPAFAKLKNIIKLIGGELLNTQIIISNVESLSEQTRYGTDAVYRHEKPNIPLKRHGVIELGDGYLYRNWKKLPNKMYLKCAMLKEINCKASYVVEIDKSDPDKEMYRCLTDHNHPPNDLCLKSARFLSDLEQAIQVLPGSTKQIFDQIIERYPDVRAVYTYSNVVGRMHHWLKKYSVHTKSARRNT